MIINITPHQAYQKVKDGSAILIDVREQNEFSEEHISPCQLIPVSEFDVKKIINPENKDVIFYCRAGVRSFLMGLEFKKTNFTDVKIYNLQGGVLKWKGEGLKFCIK